ncbi:hypothetical protein ACWJPR_02445, partial [Klebsiella pneumoniae]
NTDDLFVGKTLLHGDVLMWLMKTLLTSGCTNQRGAGQNMSIDYKYYPKTFGVINPFIPVSILHNYLNVI